MEEDFNNKKNDLIGKDNSLINIELIEVYGNRWNSNKDEEEIMLRLIYIGGESVIITLRGKNWYNILSEKIGKIRNYYRTKKLEHILDGN
jgi:hypothetical protein